MSIKRKSGILLKGIIIGLFLNFFVWAQANAIPTLQLDIEGGTYDGTTQTIVTSDNPFTLYALLIEDPNPNPNGDSLVDDDYYLVIALTPDDAGDFGSFDISSNTNTGTFSDNFLVDGNMTFGTPPLVGDDLPSHSIYDTYWLEIEFQFDSTDFDTFTTLEYNVQNDPGGTLGGLSAGTGMFGVAFEFDISGLSGTNLHFDLYQRDGEGNLIAFAPFSHDAETVPEPTTMLLLGSGLVGLMLYGRKRFRKETDKTS